MRNVKSRFSPLLIFFAVADVLALALELVLALAERGALVG